MRSAFFCVRRVASGANGVIKRAASNSRICQNICQCFDVGRFARNMELGAGHCLSLGLVRSYFADEHVGPGSKETRIGICKNDKMPVMVKQSKFFSNPFEPQSPRSTPNFSESSDTTTDSGMNLANHFLIAMPSMLDPIFGGAVVYLCEHNANGALGVIINKPTDMTLEVLFERIDLQLEIQAVRNASVHKLVMFGGPVQVERG